MKAIAKLGLLVCGITLGTACGPEMQGEEGQPAEASEQMSPKLKELMQGVNGNGQCCMAWCRTDGTYYHYGSRAVTQNCTSWVQTVCSNRGLVFVDAYWGSCNEGGVYWLS
ncbi:hypothetical protein [Hyalangium versicolor]|uniref:hypothetical protein n=1 Tax=Hyalangium versicolor TaxID=2861190 RepID=UPI001CCB8B76|nr:hypothetical protein [Hyalangium versicolor]